jgi:hypothetical protein
MAQSLTNPYTPGQVPRIFAGRVAELGRIRDQVSRVATFGELGGPLLVFHAPRGLGKTSLLRTAQRQAAELGFVSAWVACSRDRPFLPELVRSIERALHRSDLTLDADEGRRWSARLERVSVELGVPGFKVSGDIKTGAPESEPSAMSAPIGALEDLLHDAASLVRGRGGAGLIVFIDELHAASADDMSILLNALQNLDGEREDNPLAVVTAGLPVTPEAIIRAATFGERSTCVSLDLLSHDDAQAVLTAPAEALEVTWTPEALTLVTDECHGHPYLLQLLGSSTWGAARPHDGGSIEADHVRAGIPAAADQLDAMYRARWGSATPAERAFLRAMAEAGTDNVTRKQIAENLGQSTQAISVPRERLIEKGVIEPVGHGLVRFTLPGFAPYVRERAEG